MNVSKKGRALRVLLVEDSEFDAILLTRALERGGFRPETRRVDTHQAMEEALAQGTWDLILADHFMPEFSAPEALALVKARGLDIPFIIVSGHIEEETAVSAMRAGAHDYVMKDRLARLVPAVERELREAEVRRARKSYERELQQAREELEARVANRTADLQAANRKLELALEERRRLENELLEIAENERRRIGFDLHDDLGQKLTGMSLMVKGLQQKLLTEGHPYAPEAEKIQHLVEDVICHTHNLAHQFSSLSAQGDNLTSSIKALAQNVRSMFAIPCGFAFKGHLPNLPANTRLQLHKIAQEAISNAIKHGKASRVSITLAGSDNHLLLTIKNDGIPFSQPEASKNRMGLRIMHYRASTIGASLEIKPQQKSGTIVSCALPLKNDSRPLRRQAPPETKMAMPALGS
jgi:signal transduction histidine kinase